MVSHSLAALVGLLLILTGALKLREPARRLEVGIEAFRLLPRRLIPLVAALLPAIELVVGINLVVQPVGWLPWLAVTILSAYTIAIVTAIARDLATECGCFGSVMRRQASWPLVARNGALISLLVPSIVTTFGQSPPIAWLLALLPFTSALALARMLMGRRSRHGLHEHVRHPAHESR